MGTAVNYKKRLIELTEALPHREVKEILDFAQFLRAKREGFSYRQVKDSAEYVRALRAREGTKAGSAKKFIKELVEWQKRKS